MMPDQATSRLAEHSAGNNSLQALLGEDAYEDLYSPQTQMALALGRVKHTSQVYAGTVPEHITERRRIRNKAARRARRVNRQVRTR